MFSQVSNKELAAVKVIRNFLMQTGKTPSVRELMNEMGYKSPRSASVIMQNLLDKGVIKKREDGSIQLVQYEIENTEAGREQTVKVPLLGTIACGLPILAEENTEAMIAVSVKLAKPPHKYYLLRALGNSMDQKGINDGDLVLVKQQNHADDRDIVVALIDDEATIKELRLNTDNVVLMPKSSDNSHTPIILSRDFIVQGVVISTIPDIRD